MVYNWENICGQTLKVPSHYHSPDFARSWTAWSVSNIKTRSSSPWPLSKLLPVFWHLVLKGKHKNLSLYFWIWWLMSIISLMHNCLSIVFSWLGGRFAMVAADIFANSLAMMSCGGSSDVSAVSLILLFTLVNSTLTCRGGCVCSFNYAITLSPKLSLIFVLYRPFLFNSHSYDFIRKVFLKDVY